MSESGPMNDLQKIDRFKKEADRQIEEMKKQAEEMKEYGESFANKLAKIQEQLLDQVKIAADKLRIVRLQSEIENLERNIEAITVLEGSQGKEPNVEHLRQELDTKRKELEQLKEKYPKEFQKPRWWQLWKLWKMTRVAHPRCRMGRG